MNTKSKMDDYFDRGSILMISLLMILETGVKFSAAKKYSI